MTRDYANHNIIDHLAVLIGRTVNLGIKTSVTDVASVAMFSSSELFALKTCGRHGQFIDITMAIKVTNSQLVPFPPRAGVTSSSNILNQPGGAFNSGHLEPLVGDNAKIDPSERQQRVDCSTGVAFVSRPKTIGSQSNNVAATVAAASGTREAAPASGSQHTSPVRLLATLRRPLESVGIEQAPGGSPPTDDQLAVDHTKRLSVDGGERALSVHATDSQLDGRATHDLGPSAESGPSLDQAVRSNSLTHIALDMQAGEMQSEQQFELPAAAGHRAAIDSDRTRANIMLFDDEHQRVKIVSQRYGDDSEHVQTAAVIIQRAFRKYQICKRFRTITEQLRHTCQASSVIPENSAPLSSEPKSRGEQTKTGQTGKSDALFVVGTTRAAAWGSLSYAASRLAAANATGPAISSSQPKTTVNQVPVAAAKPWTAYPNKQMMVQQPEALKSVGLPATGQHNNKLMANNAIALPGDKSSNPKHDQVFAAALSFQQFESIRKRQYRVCMNVFNKNPEKGVSFLVAYSFIDSSSPYTKTSASFYHSNQLHFIDKQNLMHNQHQIAFRDNFQTCQMCLDEDNLKRNVAHFLLNRKGLAKEKIGQYLGNLQSQFNQDVLKYYLSEMDFNGLQIDLALRKFLATFRLPGEAQKIERIVDCFAHRYVQCQQHQLTAGNNSIVNSVAQTQLPLSQQNISSNRHIQTTNNAPMRNNLILLTKDEIFILTFAIIMLNTDLHSPSLKPTSRMSSAQFVNNLRGIFKSQMINESDLIEIYERVKANQIATIPDHVTHVMKVQQSLTLTNFQRKELPNLCVPYRRLVCFCRLFEVYDVNKKERIGQHQREVFLFNDLLLVTKLARRVRANTPQMYTYRQTIPLHGLRVQLFQSPHYNFGVRLSHRATDEAFIMFNARNELDQSRFVDDLSESIAEMDEMETIKAHDVVDTIHSKFVERLRRHELSHSTDNGNVIKDGRKMILESADKSKNKCDNSSYCKHITGDENKESCQMYLVNKSRFNSMMDLASASARNNSETCKSDAKVCPANQESRLELQESNNIPESQAPEARRHQRRSSNSSSHSLDSGLFLSRDVSPNQSS